MTSICLYSKYLHVILIPDKHASTVSKAFVERVVRQGGNVLNLFTDRGAEFKNKMFKKVCDTLSIHHTFTLPYSLQSNAALEPQHFVIKTISGRL